MTFPSHSNIKTLCLAVSLLFWTLQSNAQRYECVGPCQLSLKYDLIIAGTGAAVGLTGYIMSKKQVALTTERVLSFDKNDVNKFDRSAIGNSSNVAGVTSDVILFTSLVTPLALLGSSNVRQSWKEYTVMLTEVYFLTAGFTILAKELADRPRPFLYDATIPIDDKVGSFQDNSFFSGHTSLVAASSFFTASMLVYYHPDTKLKPLIWSAAAAVPAVTGYLRYADGKHFFTDIIAGYAFGATIGSMVPLIHRKIKDRIIKKQLMCSNPMLYDPVF